MDDVQLKIKAVLDKGDAQELQDDLDQRFTNVSNKFGRSLLAGVKRFAIGAAITAAVGAILSDIDKLNGEIDNTLEKYKDLKDRSRETGLTAGEYFKTNELLKLAGVNNFDALFAQFRQTLEKTNRGIPTPLAEFKGQTATADTFLQVISSLRRAAPEERRLLAGQIFGEGNVGAIDKLAMTDLQTLANRAFRGVDTDQLDQALSQGYVAAQEQMVLALRREMENLQNRSAIITSDTVRAQDKYMRAEDSRTNAQFENYQLLAQNNTLLENGLGAVATGVNKAVGWLEKGWESATSFYNDFREYDRRERARQQAAREAANNGDIFQ